MVAPDLASFNQISDIFFFSPDLHYLDAATGRAEAKFAKVKLSTRLIWLLLDLAAIFGFDVSPCSKLASRARRDISPLLIMEEAEGAENQNIGPRARLF